MNAVGIDVSKGKSMVAIIRPLGEAYRCLCEDLCGRSGERSGLQTDFKPIGKSKPGYTDARQCCTFRDQTLG